MLLMVPIINIWCSLYENTMVEIILKAPFIQQMEILNILKTLVGSKLPAFFPSYLDSKGPPPEFVKLSWYVPV